MPQLRRGGRAGGRALPVLPGAAGDGQLSVLLRARLRGGRVLPQVRRGESAAAGGRRGRDVPGVPERAAARGRRRDAAPRVRRRATASGSMPRCSSGCARSGSRRPPSFSAWRRARRAAAAAPVRYRPCLRCGKMMNRVNFGKLSGAVIDVCRGHGTFLDAGELHQIVTFIQEGGLDRARAQKIEELREGGAAAEGARTQGRGRRSRVRRVAVDGKRRAGTASGLADLIDLITRNST